MTQPRALARLGGFYYLTIILCGLGAELFVRGALIVPGAAADTAAHILAAPGLFRLGFALDLTMVLADIALAVVFFVLLRPAGETLALGAMVLRLMQAGVLAVNLMAYYAALLALQRGQGPDMALFLLDLHRHGYDLALVFFGAQCVVLGVLLIRAAWFPTALGVLSIAAGGVYLTGSATLFLAPGVNAVIQPLYAVPVAAELTLCLYLLIRGLNTARWPATV
ncbi:DUF4386 domain-containing protein [Rhodovulum adriaticum]|uniref:Uncharacterized protein DUF4386 n=1 Tax=Rhodovulum adriaticum TaxID=35804 RepID=A0A4R2NJX2_RHOAD|nr:DUF4386 domain-containing protein [Rhodovulum adriaticum]MBK1635892.1 hypothetical protein [Rhodovulum adriaticum]TCP21434.1 uncharacterized protein DUF4386 [Rhodovulum adriaticum]